ncbi:hypothetical protein OG401_41975 [Kitasatospora purpeofusca]|uniref:hypothetical protein n=1 Tax=Kitasatospora purpeofusca TaxID=67352 RepID=UPI00224EF820|nr:hypothetical protein [Kitasatospora purpeofusca]MCX4682728.1 hypothetical protein [Kitasatospora purpeofusca]MCX4690608.1 hypothetical protein [Kitasatospora purpeofusca]MCX4690790.1 hypothetical protein [Kitasatospora purpeofusca]
MPHPRPGPDDDAEGLGPGLPDDSGLQRQAAEIVGAVAAWYTAGIAELRRAVRSGSATDDDVQQLQAARREAVDDLERLENGLDDTEAASLVRRYADMLRELTGG